MLHCLGTVLGVYAFVTDFPQITIVDHGHPTLAQNWALSLHNNSSWCWKRDVGVKSLQEGMYNQVSEENSPLVPENYSALSYKPLWSWVRWGWNAWALEAGQSLDFISWLCHSCTSRVTLGNLHVLHLWKPISLSLKWGGNSCLIRIFWRVDDLICTKHLEKC